MNFNDMKPTVKANGFFGSDSFDDTLKDAMGYFAESNIQMVSGFNEILGEQALFTEYVSRLSEGLNADEAEALEQLLENSRYSLLKESTVSQVTPIVGLSMPIVRKMWVKTALKNAIPTEVAKNQRSLLLGLNHMYVTLMVKKLLYHKLVKILNHS